MTQSCHIMSPILYLSKPNTSMHSIRERYSMKYEIVELKEKKITGLAARTSNDDPKMGEIIGNLWTRLFQDNLYDKIHNAQVEMEISRDRHRAELERLNEEITSLKKQIEEMESK